MNAVFFGVMVYVLAQLAIGAYVSRRIRTEADYLIAGRSLGYGLGTFTIFATWFGAETVVGSAGSIYERGLSGGTAEPFGYGLCLIFMGLVFAVPLWRRKLTTLADLFRLRFSARVERFAVLLMVPASLLWAAAQIRAFGQVLSATSGVDVSLMITVAASVVIVYTIFGGLLADAWTDLIQGIALIVGLIVLVVMVFRDAGLASLAAIEPERMRLFGGGEVPLLQVVEAWSIPIFGSVLAAELVARVIATRSPEVARRSSLMAGAGYLALGMIPVSLGLVGASLLPGLDQPEQLLPLLAERYLPVALYTIFAGALVSAILSTVDSALLVAASLVSHNVLVPLRPGMTEAGKVLIARAGVAFFGVLAYTMALLAEGVYALVVEASAFGSAGIFIVLVFGLFSRFGGVRSAMVALAAGVGFWIAGAYILAFPYPYITSLAAAVTGYVVMGLLERRSPQETGT
jgi:Na+/proline symporter